MVVKQQFAFKKNTRPVMIAPDVIVESEGLACGDKVKLSLSVAGQQCLFVFASDGCSVCTAMGQFLTDQLYGKDPAAIADVTSKLLDGEYGDADWIRKVPAERYLCIRTPIKLLHEAVISYSPQCDIVPSAGLLACDACVSSFAMNWSVEEEEKQGQSHDKKTSLRQLLSEVRSLDDMLEMKLQRLGKSVLTEREAEELADVMNSMDKALFQKVKKLRLPMLYHNNVMQTRGGTIRNPAVQLAKRQIAAQIVTGAQIRKINQTIHQNKWAISTVKGARTAEFYDEGHYRTFLDYDYVASDFSDGAEFIHYLINVEGFKFVAGGSVPFSFKIVDDANGSETLTGHLHVEKIIQDAFQVVVDINLGGFPLGRTGIVKLNEQNIVSVEEQFVITLCHIFKHEKVYMKDINDIYYILKSGQLDFQILAGLIEVNELQLYFYVLMDFINRHFDLPDVELQHYQSFRNRLIHKLHGKTWPYSRKQHFWFKFHDTAIRSMKVSGIIKGWQETMNMSLGKENKGIPARVYSTIHPYKNIRTYLYPAVLFKQMVNLQSIAQFEGVEEVVKDCLYKYGTNLLITRFGVFISQADRNQSNDRLKVTEQVSNVLAILDLDADGLNQEYIMQARPDLWLY
ncbi:iron-sulfur cluster assembly scaffold protein [Neobacillus sp. Marseille-QA0830]